jgi:predicted helicase
MELREWQTEALSAFDVYYFGGGSLYTSGILTACCGSGKTMLGNEIINLCIDKYNLTSFVYAVPSVKLLNDAFVNFCEYFVDVHIELVGGDNSKRLNNIADIQRKCKQYKKNNKCYIIISTYDSSNKIHDAFVEDEIIPDFIIFDEAHHTTGDDKKHYHALLDSDIQFKYRLFMTATPLELIMKNKDDSDFTDDRTILSMDRVNIYGEIFFFIQLRAWNK